MVETRTQRFWKGVHKKEKESGNYFGAHKPPIPSNKEMNAMDRYGVIYDVDPQIRSIVIALNRNKFKTIASCAGHKKGERGFIGINGDLHQLTNDRRTILINLLHKYGLKNLRIYEFHRNMNFRITFTEVGIPMKRR